MAPTLNTLLQDYQDFVGDLLHVGALSCAWLFMYLCARHIIFKSFSADTCNRMVSLVHALICGSLPYFVVDLSDWKDKVGTPTTEDQLMVLKLSMGYFVYDMFCCLAIELCTTGVDAATLFHHVTTIAGLCVGVFQRTSGHELLMCLLLMEASTPFMHMRFVFREVGWSDRTFAQVNDVLFAVVFLVCRNVLGVFVVYWTLISETTPWVVKAGGVGIALVSWFWTHKLISMILRKISGKKSTKQS